MSGEYRAEERLMADPFQGFHRRRIFEGMVLISAEFVVARGNKTSGFADKPLGVLQIGRRHKIGQVTGMDDLRAVFLCQLHRPRKPFGRRRNRRIGQTHFFGDLGEITGIRMRQMGITQVHQRKRCGRTELQFGFQNHEDRLPTKSSGASMVAQTVLFVNETVATGSRKQPSDPLLQIPEQQFGMRDHKIKTEKQQISQRQQQQ